MFSLTVFLGNGMWALLFKDKNSAELAYQSVFSATEPQFGVVDDFGHQMLIKKESIHGCVLENLDQSKLGHCERALHQQRTQAKAQELAESDSTLRAHRMTRGPSVITPMGANGQMRG